MQTIYKLSVLLFALLFAVIAVFSLYAFWNGDTLVSDSENRTLQPMPALSAQTWFDATFALDLNAYISDHVLLRDRLIPVSRTLEQWMRVRSKIRIVDITKPN